MKALWIVGGGIETVPGILLAKQMGLHVVVSDVNPQAPGLRIADDAVIASTYDIETTVEAARIYHRDTRPIDGVMCIASDVPLTVASVADALGLPGIPIDVARCAMDKLAMKHKFLSDGIPVPWFTSIESALQLQQVVRREQYPLVLKPVDSRGARGVLRLTPDVDLEWAYQFSQNHSPTGRVMIEQYLSGAQISTESMVLGSVVHTPCLADRNYEFLDQFAPYMIENGSDSPSSLSPSVQQLVRNVAREAALSLGITNGVAKGDIVVHEGKPYVIEMAARLSGGYLCSHQIPHSTGVDFLGQAIRLALGEKPNPIDLQPRFQRWVSKRYLFPEPGRVVKISGTDRIQKRRGILHWEVRVKVGDVQGPIDCHPARAGVVIAEGKTREEAIGRAAAAVRNIRIETAPIGN